MASVSETYNDPDVILISDGEDKASPKSSQTQHNSSENTIENSNVNKRMRLTAIQAAKRNQDLDIEKKEPVEKDADENSNMSFELDMKDIKTKDLGIINKEKGTNGSIKKQPLSTSAFTNGKSTKTEANVMQIDDMKKNNLDQEGLENAANASRLPYNKMTFEEVNLFRDIISEDPLQRTNQFETYKSFLYIRNKILSMWVDNPKVQLVIEDVYNKFDTYTATNEKILILRIYKYLERYSYINFGVFKRIIPLSLTPKGKIIVIGAGISGLMAARQLREFGFDVTIYEARDRIGGRIATFRKGPYVADLGAMVVTGLGGNPIAILSKQISMDLTKIKQKCPIYDNSGKMLPKDRDEALEREFNKLLESTSYLSHNLDFEKIENSNPISLGDALELVIKLQEKYVKKRRIDYQTKYIEWQNKFKETIKLLYTTKEKIRILSKNYEKIKADIKLANLQALKDPIDEFNLRSAYRDLKTACNEFNEYTATIEEIQKKFNTYEENPPADMYLSVSDRQVLDWHFANLEFANATPLSVLSLKHWDQDDDFEFTGAHMTVRNGYSCLPIALSEGLNIKLSSNVKKIKYNDKGVEVQIQSTHPKATFLNNTTDTNGNSSSTNCETDKADAVLVTVPLGCLKETASSLFEPSLPAWKMDSIKRLGFGNLNKIVLCFDKIFWDPHINLFGQVPLSTSSRGELFLFWNLYKAPVLLSLVAGEAASIMENISDDLIIGRCLAVLRQIFGNSQVPAPKEVIVTRWRSDPWTRGSYSFVSVESSGKDYELLGEPISPQTNSSESSKVPRVFFAGEHTCKNYPATVHGALLSGLREARKITDIYLGSPLTTP